MTIEWISQQRDAAGAGHPALTVVKRRR